MYLVKLIYVYDLSRMYEGGMRIVMMVMIYTDDFLCLFILSRYF